MRGRDDDALGRITCRLEVLLPLHRFNARDQLFPGEMNRLPDIADEIIKASDDVAGVLRLSRAAQLRSEDTTLEEIYLKYFREA